jgi:hypothetical protein
MEGSSLSEQDRLKEQIRFNTEIIKVVSAFLLATAGSVVSFIIAGIDSGREVIFTSIGLLLSAFSIFTIRYLYRITQRLIRNGKIL